MLMYPENNTKDSVKNNEENNIISSSESVMYPGKYIMTLSTNTDMQTYAYSPCC